MNRPTCTKGFAVPEIHHTYSTISWKQNMETCAVRFAVDHVPVELHDSPPSRISIPKQISGFH